MQNRLLDRLLVDSPGWRYFVRWTITRELCPRAGLPPGAEVLDVGGGAGAGAAALLDAGVGRVDCVDLDPRMVGLARRRLSRYGARARAQQMGANRLDYPDEAFDAVLFFEVLHHLTDWRGALREAWRVLRPGGVLLVSEALRDLIALPVLRRIFPHPAEGHFRAEELKEGIYQAGFLAPGSFVVHGGYQISGVAAKGRSS